MALSSETGFQPMTYAGVSGVESMCGQAEPRSGVDMIKELNKYATY